MNLDHLRLVARTAATSDKHWNNFFQALKQHWKVDRICAALQLDDYTAYLPRVAQIDEFEPYVGSDGLYADREVSCTFDVIEQGLPYLATSNDWTKHPDLIFYSLVAQSNMKFPISLGGHAAVLNLWSKSPNAFTEEDLTLLTDITAEISRSPFLLELKPVGLSLRKVNEIVQHRQQLQKSA